MIGPLVSGLCDDAAIFPPGNLPLAEAVPAHLRHVRSSYGDLVGPLVLSAAACAQLGPLVAAYDDGVLALAVTCPEPAAIAGVAAAAAAHPAVRLVALEVALPEPMAPGEVVPAVDLALAGLDGPAPQVYVEVPRDARRLELIRALAASPYRAKFRTGGVRADLYPDCTELAAAVRACVDADLPFKATAGLHHAIRNTDPATGFDQHGFVNVLVAVAAAQGGADAAELAGVLADRDGPALAARLRALSPQEVRRLRAGFASFGTCSIDEPRDELTDLGLLGAPGPTSEGASA